MLRGSHPVSLPSHHFDFKLTLLPPPLPPFSPPTLLSPLLQERRDSPVEIMDASFPGQSSHHGAFWLRARGISKEQLAPPLQKIVLAYLSDFNFIGTVQKALGLSSLTRPDSKALRLGMMVRCLSALVCSLTLPFSSYTDSPSGISRPRHLVLRRCLRRS